MVHSAKEAELSRAPSAAEVDGWDLRAPDTGQSVASSARDGAR